MIPKIWHYLMRHFLIYFSLSLFTLVASLLSLRIEEIAQFASLGTSLGSTLAYMAYQVPYFLPQAICVSLLIASYLLAVRISESSELTALFTFGLKLNQIFFPIYFLALCFASINFYLINEIKPKSRLASTELIANPQLINPLQLLKINGVENSFAQVELDRDKQNAHDALIAYYHKDKERISLLLADHIHFDQKQLVGEGICTISTLPADHFDHLVIDNEKRISVPFSQAVMPKKYMKKPRPFDVASFKELCQSLYAPFGDRSQAKYYRRELGQRLSLSFLPISFVILGLCFGIDLQREKKARAIWQIGLIVLLTFGLLLAAKSLLNLPVVMAFCYLIPHTLIIGLSTHRIKQLKLGSV
ncbi:MAG: hypothetical protein S4CHLAM102_09410 [Chlamydiia bacterium]|nr:hypothetical protein [Chlamydiia bacterium]